MHAILPRAANSLHDTCDAPSFVFVHAKRTFDMVTVRCSALPRVVTVWFCYGLLYCALIVVWPNLSPNNSEFRIVPSTSPSAVSPKPRQAPINRFLLWLHIPKTGTSFANTLLQWGCPNAVSHAFVAPEKARSRYVYATFNTNMSWDWLSLSRDGRSWLLKNCYSRLAVRPARSRSLTLYPSYTFNMHRSMKRSEAHFTVAFFRLPRQRTYSNYIHLAFRYNETSSRKQSRMSLVEFARKPKFMSQQAKLLLGRHYRHRGKVSVGDAHQAAYFVVNTLPYVGLTEEFRLSVRLFHAIFGGFPDSKQFENIRPSVLRQSYPLQKSSFFRYDETEFGSWRDVADEIIYSAAFYRFWKDVCRLRTEIEADGFGFVFIPLCYVPRYTR